MAFKYTGRADTFTFNGRTYAKPELYERNPKAYYASYDSNIVGMTEHIALHLINHSNMHDFEQNGEDLLEKVTAAHPEVSTPAAISTVLDSKEGKK